MPAAADGEAEAMRQPDALQPDDEHELDAAAAEGGEQARDVAGGEGAVGQGQPEHRLRHLVSTQPNRMRTAIPPKMPASAQVAQWVPTIRVGSTPMPVGRGTARSRTAQLPGQ